MVARMGCGPPTLPSPHPAPRAPHPSPRAPQPAARTPRPRPAACTPRPAPRALRPAPCTPHPAPPVTPLTLPSPPTPDALQNFELHNELAHVVAHQHTGQNVKVSVRDCASAGGYCALNVVGSNAWLADHRIFDCTVSLFFLPNHGKMFVRSAPLPPSHRVSAARAAPLRHSVNLAHAQPDKDFGICDICWRKEDSGVVCQLAGMPGIVLSATPSP